MGKMGLGGILLGAAAMAVAGAAASGAASTPENRNERIIKNIVQRSQAPEAAISAVRQCIDANGHVDEEKAIGGLSGYLFYLRIPQIWDEEYFENFENTPPDVIAKYQQEFMSELFEGMKKERIDSLTSMIEYMLNEMKMSFYFDIYGNDIPKNEREAKIGIYYGEYYKKSRINNIKVIDEQSEIYYRMAKILNRCVKDDGRVDMDAYSQAKKLFREYNYY